MEREDIKKRVYECIADVLAVESSEIEEEMSLVDDLGAESLDFLDLMFRLEKEFGISVSKDEIDLYSRLRLDAEEFEKDGLLTEKAIEKIRAMAPEIDGPRLKSGISKYELVKLVKVRSMVTLVASKVG